MKVKEKNKILSIRDIRFIFEFPYIRIYNNLNHIWQFDLRDEYFIFINTFEEKSGRVFSSNEVQQVKQFGEECKLTIL